LRRLNHYSQIAKDNKVCSIADPDSD